MHTIFDNFPTCNFHYYIICTDPVRTHVIHVLYMYTYTCTVCTICGTHAHTYNPNTLTHAPQRIQHLKIFFPGDATVHTHDTACIR